MEEPATSPEKRPLLADGTTLGRPSWPPALEADFSAFTKWATEPLVENREAKFKKRLSTVEAYQTSFEGYFGYLHQILHIQPVQFDHLFDWSLIRQYITWHVNEKHKRSTRTAHEFLRGGHRARARQSCGGGADPRAL
jgi:hypothetical protein